MTPNLYGPIANLLGQLEALLEQLDDTQYRERLPILSNVSLGQHTRHILEFFLELEKGYETGLVDYDRRKRDQRIENSRVFAIGKLREVAGGLDKPNKEMTLAVDLDKDEMGLPSSRVSSNYYRELVYNLEHTVHHMALLRIGIEAISGPALPDGFGVAVSTLKHRMACAQ